MVFTQQYNVSNLTAKQKLCLNLAKDLFTVLADDSEKVASLKGDITEIDEVLKNGNEEEILQCNSKMTSKYWKYSSFPHSCFSLMSREEFRKKTYIEKCYTLQSIGMVLSDMISKEKLKELGKEALKSGTEYAIDKIKEKNQRHNSQ